MRMDLWHRHAREARLLPAGIQEKDLDEIEDLLGFCRSARYRAGVSFEFPEGWVRRFSEGDTTVTQYRLPGATLTKVYRVTGDQAAAGMRGQVIRHPVTTEPECHRFLESLEHATLAADLDGFDAYDRRVGESGLPVLILGPSPAHYVMLEIMGYEAFYLAMHDFPDTLDALVRRLEQRFEAELWDRALRTGAELILHGTHFSDAMTPEPIFRRYLLPYFERFIPCAHAAGKRVLWHADAGMGTLLGLVLESGFDGADCLATAPLVAETIEDYDRAWKGRIVCWGGIPGTLFDARYPRDSFLDHASHLRQYTAGRAGFIIGASDNLLPGAEWERILTVSEVFRREGGRQA